MDTKNSNEELENENELMPTGVGSKVNSINKFVQKYSKIIIIVSIVIVVCAGLIYLIIANNAKKEANASKALARIEQYYTKGDYKNALKGNDSLPTVRGEKVIGLLEIIKEYGSTSAGERASLYAADSYFKLGNYKEAKIYYEKAIKSGIDVINVGGYAGVAACNEKSGNYKEAAEGYLKAVDYINDDSQKMRYMYFAALCKEKAKDKEEAIKIYRDILELNKYGEFNNLAKAGITRLGAEVE
ncbi:MAG: tetratricopeptide repeat protein [Bacteroidetes bacterium]|nr:tetratricopeptide repeat protein [Bacteroidota bacterium]